jgi:thiol-disulfide isomerase/thioredoxin
MKVRYFATLASISLLSLGAIVGCANSSTPNAQTPASNGAEVSSNPCASANPCAAKANPCAAKANPCAAKANPCAAKTNPCAGKTASVGAPLTQELQGKPVVIDVFAEWCPACKNIAPTLSQLEKDYADRVHFVVLDVTDQSTTAEADAKAKQLGLSSFLAANKSQTGMLTIVDPATGNILAQHRNNPKIEDYQTVLDAALKQ